MYPDLLSRVLRARFLYFYFTLSVAPRRGPRPYSAAGRCFDPFIRCCTSSIQAIYKKKKFDKNFGSIFIYRSKSRIGKCYELQFFNFAYHLANILSIWLLLLSQELFRFFKNLNTRERKIHRELLPITHIARNALTALRGSRPLYNLLLLMLSLYFRLRLHITRERKRRIALT